MVKKLLTVFMLGAAAMTANAQYQLANSDFEEWESVTYNRKTGDEPKNWSSFLDGTGSYKGSAAASQMEKSTDVRTSSTGTYSARIFARSVFTVVAQGNLTNGCINMGSMTATSATGNYNYINEAREDQAMRFSGHPDAMKVWIKYKGNDATYNKGNVCVLLTTKGYYQDPYANESKITATLVAKANNPEIVSNDTWTEYTIPFTYLTEDAPYYSLVTFSTCATPGKGNKNDYMFVDDAVMVYNSELENATFDGSKVIFTDGAANVDAAYDAAKLVLTSNGHAATIEKSYDSETAVLTITVKGENISEDAANQHVYTIQFAQGDAPAGPEVVRSDTHTAPLYVSVNGAFNAPQDANIQVETLDNGNINFVLKNFILDGDIYMPVGNIEVDDLELNANKQFSFEGGIWLTAGDDNVIGEDETWMGPFLCTDEEGYPAPMHIIMKGQFVDDKVYVDIYIDMMEVMGQFINVHLGDDYIPATMAVNAEAKYGTFCAPFDVVLSEEIDEAYTAEINEDGVHIDLTETFVAGETIPANTPVILEASYGMEEIKVYGKPVAGNTTVGCLTGVYEDTEAPVGSYVLQNQNNKVGFYQVGSQRPTIKANRAYINAPAGARVLTFGDETAISSINMNANANAAIYNIAGQRVSKAEKGIFIINGKKVVK